MNNSPTATTNLKDAAQSELRQMLYLSAAVRLMDDAELAEILAVSRRNNTRDGVSGMLLYDAGNFVQFLEGPPDAVEAAWRRIQRDQRHKGVIVASDKPAKTRLFPDWSMGFEAGGGDGGFHLDWEALQTRTPDDFPKVVQTIMRAFYTAGR